MGPTSDDDQCPPKEPCYEETLLCGLRKRLPRRSSFNPGPEPVFTTDSCCGFIPMRVPMLRGMLTTMRRTIRFSGAVKAGGAGSWRAVVVVVVFAIAAMSAAGASAATSRVLFAAPSVHSSMAGGGRIAWIKLGVSPCLGYSVWVHREAAGPSTRVTSCIGGSGQHGQVMLGVSAKRLYWHDPFGDPGGLGDDDSVLSKLSTAKVQLVDHLLLSCGGLGCLCRPPSEIGDTLAAGAMAGNTLVYATSSWRDDPATCDVNGCGSKVLSGGSARRATTSGHVVLDAAPGASLVAASGGRFAELPLMPGGPSQPLIEVRNASSGALIKAIDTGGTVTQLSMSVAGVVAQVDVSGAHTLRLYNPSSGGLVRSIGVRPTARLVNASGWRALYTGTNHGQLRTFNLISGKTHFVYQASPNLSDLRLDGRHIIWRTDGPKFGFSTFHGITLSRLGPP